MKTFVSEVRRTTGMSSKKKDTTIYSKSQFTPDKTTIMMKFGNKFMTTETSDLVQPDATYVTTMELPGKSLVSS